MQATIVDTRHRVGVYAWSPGTGGVHHYRIAEPLRVLASNGYPASTGIELSDPILETVDTVLGHMLHTEEATEAWQRLAKLDSHRLVLDVDDAMWAPDWHPFARHYTPDVLARVYANVRAAHVVTTPSEVIAEHLAKYNRNVWLVPNTVPAWLLDHRMPDRDRPTIGWQGSPSHAQDWTHAQQLNLAKFLVRNESWGLHLYGTNPGGFARFGQRCLYTPWVNSVDDYHRRLSFDIGIGPLRDTQFNRSKSGLRAIEYAALGIVSVLPDLPPYRRWVRDGITGRLVRSHQTLRGVLQEVADDQPGRLAMATNARATARNWTTEARIKDWVTAWESR